MLLFVPFRPIEDLKPGGGFYQSAFQKAHEDGRITKEMIEIAENIQTIHNSLASRMPENSLSAETELMEKSEFENTDADDDDDNYEDLLASIGELFVTLTNGKGLKDDSDCLDIQFGDKQMEESSLSITELETVFQFTHLEDNEGDVRQNPYPTERFRSTTNHLNTLALRTRVTRTAQATEDEHATETKIISADGTWQSIARWGENGGLDGDQLTAFEILAATYVLSFYDEAVVEATNSENYEEFVKRKNYLCQLARRNTNNEKPLCMFITGPAGAGKCKFR